mgnify:CR=1 FL=1
MAHNGHPHLHAPNEDDIDEDLWRSPSEKDTQLKAIKSEQFGSGAGGSQLQTGKSKYENGEDKEVELRNELENVRKVNEAIEGVIESLDKAKSSMTVSLPVLCTLIRTNILLAVCQSNGQFSFRPPQHMDTHSVTDRAQSKIDTGPCVARSQPGSG